MVVEYLIQMLSLLSKLIRDRSFVNLFLNFFILLLFFLLGLLGLLGQQAEVVDMVDIVAEGVRAFCK